MLMRQFSKEICSYLVLNCSLETSSKLDYYSIRVGIVDIRDQNLELI